MRAGEERRWLLSVRRQRREDVLKWFDGPRVRIVVAEVRQEATARPGFDALDDRGDRLEGRVAAELPDRLARRGPVVPGEGLLVTVRVRVGVRGNDVPPAGGREHRALV